MSVTNAGEANEAAAALTERREETVEQREENLSLKDQIQRDIERQTVTLELGRREVQFQVMMGAEMNEMDDMRDEVAAIGERAEEEDWDEARQLREARPFFNRMAELMAEKDTTGDLDADWWQDTFGRSGVATQVGRLRQKSERAGMSDEELQQFRGE